MNYSRRFKLGAFRYMTRASIEDGYLIIGQNERTDYPKIDNRNSVILALEDVKQMLKTLGIDSGVSK